MFTSMLCRSSVELTTTWQSLATTYCCKCSERFGNAYHLTLWELARIHLTFIFRGTKKWSSSGGTTELFGPQQRTEWPLIFLHNSHCAMDIGLPTLHEFWTIKILEFQLEFHEMNNIAALFKTIFFSPKIQWFYHSLWK